MKRAALLAGVLAVSVLLGVACSSGSPAVPVADKPPTAQPPTMGWNSWNKFGCAVTEQIVRENADGLVTSGLAAAGYRYVTVDDCWMAPERDPSGRLQADPQRFPSGMKALADFVHGKGLKFGIYSSAGTATCQNLPASLDHEKTDAASFAAWGVDLLKYDNCNNQGRPAIDRYRAMADALAATGRHIIYSICEWGDNQPWKWASGLGARSWRTYGDVTDDWASTLAIIDRQVGLESFSGPNGWNDPDSLEIGNGGMTTEEYRAQMSMWALLNAPLFAGNDLRSMSALTHDLLTNADVIAVNQDWAGVQGHRITKNGDREVWAKPTSTGGAAVVLLNRGPDSAEIATAVADLGLPSVSVFKIRDLWAGTFRLTPGDIEALVPGHGAKMLLVSPASVE